MITEVSAGGVIFDDDKVLVLRRQSGEWVMPKGHVDFGEAPEQAAVREVFEETGIKATVVGKVGETQYRFRISTGEIRQKVVHWHLMLLGAGPKELHIEPIFAEGAFVPIDVALQTLTFQSDKEILRQAVEQHKQRKPKRHSVSTEGNR